MHLPLFLNIVRAFLTGRRFKSRWRNAQEQESQRRHQPTDPKPSNTEYEEAPLPGPELPPEVWENCWRDGLLSPADLKSLSATSRYFRAMCEPDIYRVINLTLEEILSIHSQTAAPRILSPRLTPDAILTRMNQMYDKLKGLAESEVHRSYVREFHFQTVPNILHFLLFRFPTEKAMEIGHIHKKQVDHLFTVLPSFHNIHTLSLSLIDIDERALDAISKLKALDNLIVNEAFFACRRYSPRLALETLDLAPGTKYDETFYFPDIFAADRLRTLKFQTICFREGTNVLSVMGKQGPAAFSLLSTLEISLPIDSTHILESFLRDNGACIETLKVDFYMTLPVLFPLNLSTALEQRSFHIPSSAVPSLRCFSGPLFVAKSMLPGRPVSSIEIKSFISDDEIRTWQDIVQHIIPLCQEIACDIVDLELSFNLDVQNGLFEMISEHFPALRSLGLTLVSDRTRLVTEDFPISLVTRHDGMPSAEDLTFRGILERLALKHIPLPPHIIHLSLLYKTFCMRMHNLLDPTDPPCRPPRFWPVENQKKYLETFSERYPGLETMSFGMDNQPLLGSSNYEPFKWSRSKECGWSLDPREKRR